MSPEKNRTNPNALEIEYEREKVYRLKPDEIAIDDILWHRIKNGSGASFTFYEYLVQIVDKTEGEEVDTVSFIVNPFNDESLPDRSTYTFLLTDDGIVMTVDTVDLDDGPVTRRTEQGYFLSSEPDLQDPALETDDRLVLAR